MAPDAPPDWRAFQLGRTAPPLLATGMLAGPRGVNESAAESRWAVPDSGRVDGTGW